jgi:hypothetical protein
VNTILELLREWDPRTDWEGVDLEKAYFFEKWFVHEDDSILDAIRETTLPRTTVLSIDEEGTPSIAEAILWGDIVQAYQRLFVLYPEDAYLIRVPEYDSMIGRPRPVAGTDFHSIKEYLDQQVEQRNMNKEEWSKQAEVRELARAIGYDIAIRVLTGLHMNKDRWRGTETEAREDLLNTDSNMIRHLLDNGDGTFSIMEHIVCEMCDYCYSQGDCRGRTDNYLAVPFQEDPYGGRRFCGETNNIQSESGRTTCGTCTASAPNEVWNRATDVVQQFVELLNGCHGIGSPDEMLGHVIDTLNDNGFDVGNAPGVAWRTVSLFDEVPDTSKSHERLKVYQKALSEARKAEG